MKRQGFTLVEVVIALGLFAFCIVVILGMMAIGLRTARSVADETVAVSISQSVLAGWKMQTNKNVSLTISNLITNVPALSSSGRKTFYFDGEGIMVDDIKKSSLKMDYEAIVRSNASGVGSNAVIKFDFQWPANAPTNVAQTRQIQGAINF